MKVAAIGDNCIDVYPKLNKSYPTGNAVDFAVNLRKLGVSTSIITVIGDDKNGEDMLCALQDNLLDTSHLKIQLGPTAVTVMELDGNERVHGEYLEGVMARATFSTEDIAFASSHDIVHSTLLGHAEMHLHEMKAAGARISFDFSTELESEFVNRTIQNVDYAFFSYLEDDQYIREFLTRQWQKGPQVTIATLGEKGSIAYDGNSYHKAGIVPAKVVNTIGAGDSFISGFIYGVVNGWTLDDCLAKGAAVAAEVVSVFGPWKEN